MKIGLLMIQALVNDEVEQLAGERYKLSVDAHFEMPIDILERDDVPPTNNASEQAIRFVVIDRNVTMGTRSDASAFLRTHVDACCQLRQTKGKYFSIPQRCDHIYLLRYALSQIDWVKL
jgi:hypothetical protein